MSGIMCSRFLKSAISSWQLNGKQSSPGAMFSPLEKWVVYFCLVALVLLSLIYFYFYFANLARFCSIDSKLFFKLKKFVITVKKKKNLEASVLVEMITVWMCNRCCLA